MPPNYFFPAAVSDVPPKTDDADLQMPSWLSMASAVVGWLPIGVAAVWLMAASFRWVSRDAINGGGLVGLLWTGGLLVLPGVAFIVTLAVLLLVVRRGEGPISYLVAATGLGGTLVGIGLGILLYVNFQQ